MVVRCAFRPSDFRTAVQDKPVIVFEAGATNSLEVWGGILPQVASMAPVVTYDRAGLGRSEWDDTTPTPRHVADRLQQVMQQIGADPPYVLVGFSWGGMLARYFAGYYPSEIVGLVFVDPSPMVTESLADNLMPFEAIGVGRAGFEAYWSSFAALIAQAYSRRYAPKTRCCADCWKEIWQIETSVSFPRCRWSWL